MVIKVRYDKVVKTFDIPEDEFDQMVETDYQKRLAEAETDEEKAKVKYRTPQEIMNEMNNKEQYNMRKFYSILESYPERKKTERGQLIYSNDDEKNHNRFSIDMIEDPNPEIYDSEYEDTCKFIRSVLKSNQAELLISVILDGVHVGEIAKKEGVSSQAISHRLETAKNNLKKFL